MFLIEYQKSEVKSLVTKILIYKLGCFWHFLILFTNILHESERVLCKSREKEREKKRFFFKKKSLFLGLKYFCIVKKTQHIL